MFPDGDATNHHSLPQNNNLLHVVETVTEQGIQHQVHEIDYTGLYFYRANGFPAQIYSANTATGAFEKIAFFYKAL